MIGEDFIARYLTAPVAIGRTDGCYQTAYARGMAARRGDPLHELYREYCNGKVAAEKHGGKSRSWGDVLWDAGIHAPADVPAWIKSHPLPKGSPKPKPLKTKRAKPRPRHPWCVYPTTKASRHDDPFYDLYLDYNRRRKQDAKHFRTPISWQDTLAEQGILTREDVERYIKDWREKHEG